ncbi:MAG: protein translocase subunit SecF, partial [Oscillospiraceae bacterium]|nr:protein translocase subunit SecF [Oscillospiraceae bacterium]
MHKTKIKFVEHLKAYLIGSIVFIIIGVIAAIAFGVKMDINFTGGSRFSYTYSGELSTDDAAAAISDTLQKSVEVSQSADITGATSKLIVLLASNEALTTEQQASITTTLETTFPDNSIGFSESNTVNPTVAGGFFTKAIVAVLLASILVIIYIGIRFRKIGGVSAGAMALVALVHDVLIAFFVCVIFRLQLDANFIAVVLTLLGYSLNDTVVIYDRIRENERLYPNMSKHELVNASINQTLGRTLITATAVFFAIATVAVVSIIFGITSLLSFAIPMCFATISGCYSTVCIAGPLWVKWCEYSEKHKKIKEFSNKSNKKSSKSYYAEMTAKN